MKTIRIRGVVLAGLALATAAGSLAIDPDVARERGQAQAIFDATGVKGGLIVHLGCGDGKLTAALRVNDSCVVHGLDREAKNVETARRSIQALGLYGAVSVEQWPGGRLPYAENLVNLVVAENLGGVSLDEVMRVLAPLGVAYVKQGGQWTKTAKPWPKDMDEWTHWLHDAGNNAVAHDTRVGAPQRMQWVAEPIWSRGHELITSVGGVVTARGRIIYAVDEGQTGIYTLSSRWTLVARDAFNGVLLWKQPLPHWAAPVVLGGHTSHFLPRRLVTDGERVYLPMGKEAVLASLDAATGRPLKTLDAARGTATILCADGLLVAQFASQAGADEKGGKKAGGTSSLAAVQPDTFKVLWQSPVAGVVNSTLALAEGRVFFKAGAGVVALDAKTGREDWRAPLKEAASTGARKTFAPTLLVHDGRVCVLSGSRLAAVEAATGKVLWELPRTSSSKGELFAAGGLIWRVQGGGVVVGHDPATGEVRKTVDASSVFSPGHHLRCYPDKATDRFIITNNRGAEFVSLTSNEHVKNDWVRGNCGHGVMPANGLLYAPPNQCFCYPGVMLTGFKSLAPGPVPIPDADPATDAGRLERGPAYDAVWNPKPAVPDSSDWPMYRHDPARFGSTMAAVAPGVAPLWQAGVGERLTPPVAAEGMVLVAARDADTLYAFDAKDGRPRWSFIAGGRIDSPPTLHEGLALFGAADGWVYCLRASDGVMAWRFRAAPEERRVGAFGRIESAWPVHGSVLALKGVVYATAGRSTYLDGGIYAYGLDPRTGRVLHYARLAGGVAAPDAVAPDGKPPYVPAFHIEGARDDLLVSDGSFLYMGPLKLDAKLAVQPAPYIAPTSKTMALDLASAPYVDTGVFKMGLEKKRGKDFPSLGVLRGPMGDKQMGLRLLATGGFLDDTWFNRTFWMYSRVWPGFYIGHLGAKTGDLLVVDGAMTYGVQAFPSRNIHSPLFSPGGKGYLLFADDNANEPVLDDRTRDRDKGMGFTRDAPPKWFQWAPVRIRAMVAAGPELFVAGAPDVMDAADPYAAFEGRKGAVLWRVDKADGHKVADLTLDSAPVFDGLIAAGGRLYASLADGKLVCLASKP